MCPVRSVTYVSGRSPPSSPRPMNLPLATSPMRFFKSFRVALSFSVFALRVPRILDNFGHGIESIARLFYAFVVLSRNRNFYESAASRLPCHRTRPDLCGSLLWLSIGPFRRRSHQDRTGRNRRTSAQTPARQTRHQLRLPHAQHGQEVRLPQ